MNRVSVLITGASTGIGLAVAQELAQAGHEVFAGVRNEKAAASVREVDARIQPVLIDVTKSETILECYEQIERARTKDLPFSLVNNAGIAVAGPIEAIALSEFRKQFDVNVFGLVETTQVFLPMIRAKRGRVVNVSSVNGFLVPPFLGVYSASKFAVEAISDALRRELLPEGIKVITIQPGPIATPIWDKGIQNKAKIEATMNPDRIGRYKNAIDVFEAEIELTAKNSIPATVVAKRIRHALTDKNPNIREVVAGPTKNFIFGVGRRLPTSWMDSIVKRHFAKTAK